MLGTWLDFSFLFINRYEIVRSELGCKIDLFLFYLSEFYHLTFFLNTLKMCWNICTEATVNLSKSLEKW